MTNPRPSNRPQPGERLVLDIETTDEHGAGVAHQGGLRWLIHGAFDGERIVARVEHVSRQRPLGHARLLEVLRAHPARRRPPCARHVDLAATGCTGCPLMTLDVDGQRSTKTARLAALGLYPDRWISGNDGGLGYRASSKRVAQGPAGRLHLGSFVRGSHRVADMTGCLVEHPTIQRCADQIQKLANELRIPGYDEQTKSGELRYVWLKSNGQQVLVTLIAATALTPAMRALAERLDSANGVTFCVQGSDGNRIRGEQTILLRGEPTLRLGRDEDCTEVAALGFLQPNPALARAAYDDLCHDAHGVALAGSLAVDPYAGAGDTAKRLRAGYTTVLASDADPTSAALLGVPPQDAATLLSALAERGEQADLVVCNPPRGGMGAAACDALLRLGPTRIHIMSCSPETLRADLDRLAGRYKVGGCRAYDTLAQTAHVELVVWLERRLTSPSA